MMVPKNGWCTEKKSLKWMIWGYPYCKETPKSPKSMEVLNGKIIYSYYEFWVSHVFPEMKMVVMQHIPTHSG